MSTNEETKKCSFCAEEVKREAVKCKHCGEKLEDSNLQLPKLAPEKESVLEKILNKPRNLLIILMLSIFVPATLAWSMNITGSSSSSTAAVKQLSVFDKLLIAFEGGYSMDEIMERMSKTMTLYGLELTEENYSRAGSVLVSMRNEYGVQEMEILDYMIRSHVPNVNIDFPTMAAMATTMLVTQ